MVEFALVLPILALLLVMAIDFGRVFFGWVALQNAARIAADTAAGTADAWPADNPNEDILQARYQAAVTRD
ncbi:MAG: pilus assembly protein, partial [Chloroflexota bacterium]|nr:pilus assembly protein [Chloroflexota bacterium]